VVQPSYKIYRHDWSRSVKTTDLPPLVALILSIGMGVQQNAMAVDQDLTPDLETRAFYVWYIQLQSRLGYPLLDKNISRYVAQRTVDRLRDSYRHDRLPGDVDYFTKVQDYDDRDWASHIKTYPETLLGDVAVVPVTLGFKEPSSIIVFLRKQAKGWKIFKVDDTRDNT